MKYSLLIFFIAIQFNSSFAQTDSVKAIDPAKSYKLNVISNFDDAKIYFDTVYIGKTPLENFPIKGGKYKIKILNTKSSKFWENDNKIFEIKINSDTTINVKFDYFYFINTNPFNANVFKNDILLGITPFRFFSENKLKGNLAIKKKNYKDYTFDLTSYDFETGVNITLKPKGNLTINDIVYKNRGTQFKTKRDIFAIAISGVAAIISGYTAFNFKIKGNEAYDQYLQTSNDEDLNRSNHNDTYFAISLVAMQAALGGLIYFLFIDK